MTPPKPTSGVAKREPSRAAAEHVPGAVLDAGPGERAVVPRVREAA